MLLAGGRGDEMVRSYLPGSQRKQVNIILIKNTGGERKRPSTIDFKAFVFFFVCDYIFFLTVIFINKSELTE